MKNENERFEVIVTDSIDNFTEGDIGIQKEKFKAYLYSCSTVLMEKRLREKDKGYCG